MPAAFSGARAARGSPRSLDFSNSCSPKIFSKEWFSNVRGDLLAGIVVALALIPEAIAFSIIAGVDPKVGLYASFCIAVMSAIFGGRPGMISAATAATALLMVTLVKEHGLQYLLAATVLTGVLQVIAGAAAHRHHHALCFALGDDRFRQRAGDPHLHGAVAGVQRRGRGRLCDGRRGARDHLSASARHQGCAIAAGRDHRAHRRLDDLEARRAHRRRSRRTAVDAPAFPLAASAAESRDALDHPALLAGHRRRGAAGIADDRADRG